MTDERIYLEDIRDRIQRIETYTQGGKAEFLQSFSIICKKVFYCDRRYSRSILILLESDL